MVGWHGADWKSIHPLIDGGTMPNLRSIVERGIAGNVKSIGPNTPAMLWTSVATGKTPDQHGVLSGIECDPISGGVRAAGNSTRRVKTLWNIAMQSGLAVHVAGWAGAHPTEPLNGSSIAHDFVRPLAQFNQPWPILPGSIHPDRLRSKAAELRVHAGELTGDYLTPFIPALAQIDQEKDGRVLQLADILAKAISMHAIVTWLMENEAWDLMMIGWDALERACHQFMRYAPPQMGQVSSEDAALYGGVVTGMYCFLDLFLGRLMHLAGPDATVVIVSPAGFRAGNDRPVSPYLQSLPGAWYRPYGILAMAGKNIVADELVHGATVLDIAPTVLTVLGLPAAQDMPGKIIESAFVDAPAPARVASWEDVPGDCGMPARESAAEREASAAALAELQNAGYREPADSASLMIQRDRLLNTALVHLAMNRYAEARPVLAQLAAETPEDPKIPLWLAHCHFVCHDYQGCREALRNAPRDGITGAFAHLIEARLEIAQANAAKAIALIEKAESLGSDIPIVNYAAALMYVRLDRSTEAARLLRRAVELDPAFQSAYAALSRILSDQGQDQAAAQAALEALELDYSSAISHFALGIAMVGVGTGEQARVSFERSLLFDPQLSGAREWAAALRSAPQ